ncbi:MAG: hypothetical protein AVDCRST_MAG56-2085 [uncultured Cytophagales bacterium]|uniref:Uncharacterized protein n=1 Tax=uncultured Cytophagales bacterium TaxID=158755 RepID=A0A6J4IKU6_9SPHI|nr:MAG: hypothetical protein AVDCRST_MAG56-2085 [uncultured Cytophagales bacterium]
MLVVGCSLSVISRFPNNQQRTTTYLPQLSFAGQSAAADRVTFESTK